MRLYTMRARHGMGEREYDELRSKFYAWTVHRAGLNRDTLRMTGNAEIELPRNICLTSSTYLRSDDEFNFSCSPSDSRASAPHPSPSPPPALISYVYSKCAPNFFPQSFQTSLSLSCTLPFQNIKDWLLKSIFKMPSDTVGKVSCTVHFI